MNNNAESEMIIYLNKYFDIINRAENNDEQINNIIEYLGKEYGADRSYIFEINNSKNFDNTYEWCENGITPQIQNLQNEKIDDWLIEFKKENNIEINDIEEIKHTSSSMYAILKPQNIYKLLAFPIKFKSDIVGFVGFDNPKITFTDSKTTILNLLSRNLTYLLSNKKKTKELEYLLLHDKQTCSLSRNALIENFALLKDTNKMNSIGIISIDILGILDLYENYEEEKGIKHILKCNKILSETFCDYKLYQICNEKFVIVMENISQMKFEMEINRLNCKVEEETLPLCIGAVFDEDKPVNFEKILYKAQFEMNINKAKYYNDYEKRLKNNQGYLIGVDDKSRLFKFIYENNIDLDLFFDAISVNNESFPYVGSMENNTWYISDSIKEVFGFEDNIVHDLLSKWENIIADENDLKLFREKIKDNLTLKDFTHDLVYKVRDKNDEKFLIRCFGLVELNEDKTKVKSFCGKMYKLNYTMTVDPITNFKNEQAAITHTISSIQNNNEISHICFKLNHFADINQLIGRDRANDLLKKISDELVSSFSSFTSFFRFDGLRFLLIISTSDEEILKKKAEKIRNIVNDVYTKFNIFISNACFVGIINSNSKMSVKEIMESVSNIFILMKTRENNEIIYSNDTIKYNSQYKKMIMKLNKDVKNNLENFRLVVQPIVSAKTGKILSAEALLRWNHEGEDISPYYFIPELEKTGLIVVVGKWVAEQTSKISKRAKSYNKDFFIDFNVSYKQIFDDDFLVSMRNNLEKYELEGKDLVVELTENHNDDAPLKSEEFLNEIKKLDLRVALDDFGVAYSSLERLFKYPADIIKLDKSIMQKMSDEEKNSKFISSIISACHKIDKIVCVEGVETEKQLRTVRNAGVDMIQGYYFYKPMEIGNFFEELSIQKN